MKSKIIRLMKFGIVGVSGVVVNQGMLMLLREITPFSLEVRSPIAIEVAIISNFILNNYWTWKDRKVDSKVGIAFRFLMFNLSSGGTAFFFNYLPLLFMVHTMHLHEDMSNIIGIVLAAGFNFLISHFITFRHKKEN